MGWMKHITWNPFPWRSIKRTGSNIMGSVSRTKAAVEEMKSAQEKKAAEEVSQGITPEDKFNRLYEAGAWDEESLAIQLGKIRVAKFFFLVVGLCLIPVQLATYLFIPWILAIFLAPVGTFFSLFLLIQAAKHGWWQFQLEERSMISFRTFFSRADFLVRVFA